MDYTLGEGKKSVKDFGYVTKMAAMPINGKNLKNLLVRNCWTDFKKNLHACSLRAHIKSLLKKIDSSKNMAARGR